MENDNFEFKNLLNLNEVEIEEYLNSYANELGYELMDDDELIEHIKSKWKMNVMMNQKNFIKKTNKK